MIPNLIQQLQAALTRRFPGITIELDPPADPGGPWFLDVYRADDLSPVVVEWRPDRGFGVSTLAVDGDDFGTGPDEVFAGMDETLARVVELVENGGETKPPQEQPKETER